MSSRYARAHLTENLAGPGDGRPTAIDIIHDNQLTNKLVDKTILITGCSSGIGVETARALKSTGATIFATVRDLAKGQTALHDILEEGKVELLQLDLNSLQSVRSCAAEFLQKSSSLNILINNAGVMGVPSRTLTADGFEAQLGTNHLAHFLLFQLLKPTLLESSTPEFASRVICVSSAAHTNCGINFSDLQLEQPDSYKPFMAYGQSKTANIYMANEIERRYGRKGLHGWSLHPGGIRTGLQINMPASMLKTTPAGDRQMKSVEQGAATTIFAAVDKSLEGEGGKYLIDCGIARSSVELGQERRRDGYAEWAYDENAASRLWEESCKLVGIDDD